MTDVVNQADREGLARALHELQASEARVRRNAERVYAEVRANLVGELLPILDNLDRSLDAAPPHRSDSLFEGVVLIRAQFEQVLVRYGVERIDAVGRRFDPAIHEAIGVVPVADARIGMVIEQITAGYRHEARLLRPAKVTVGVART